MFKRPYSLGGTKALGIIFLVMSPDISYFLVRKQKYIMMFQLQALPLTSNYSYSCTKFHSNTDFSCHRLLAEFGDLAWNNPNRYWCIINPRQTFKAPLHDQKTHVWCAITATRIRSTFFFKIALFMSRRETLSTYCQGKLF
jgi:hypothetical protein